jgi:ribosome biogenesis SPOUT family RNA methylase Rps3
MKYIIEHLDGRLYKWCFLEYKHAAKLVGKDNIIFTNLITDNSKERLSKYGKTSKKSVADINKVTSKRICVLDPNASKELTTADKNRFDYLIFGGIMGDYPPKKRTKGFCTKMKEKEIKFETRNMGKEQMSTDTAVLVSKMIMDGRKFSNIKFKDTIIIEINDSEEVELPFRYVIESGSPVLPPGLVDHLKKRGYF